MIDLFHETDLSPVVSPTTELHLTFLVIEWKPRDIYLAGGFEYPGGDIGTRTLIGQHYIGRVGAVKRFISTKHKESNEMDCKR